MGQRSRQHAGQQPNATWPRGARQSLTVLIPCKDECRNIRACIESVRPIAHEILVADSGSTDGTLEIVGRLGDCRIIERVFVNDADFKNWAIPQAANSWVLIVDADERIPIALVAEIEAILRDPPDHLDAYRCGFQDFFLGHPLKYARWDTDSIRLIRRDACRYQKRRVHADIDIDRRRVGRLRTRILHYSIRSYEDFISKYNRYTTWGAEELWDRGRRAGFFSLLIRPALRFLNMYIIRRGFLDGLPGLQVCILMAFFSTFAKQGKLWQIEDSAAPQAENDRAGQSPSYIRLYDESSQTHTRLAVGTSQERAKAA
jgi:glycosyltransferase involved in cell wall biosynthesis